MIDGLPPFVPTLFAATTFLTIGFLFYAIRQTGFGSLAAKAILVLVPSWLLFQTVLALSGFYQNTGTAPPRIFLFAALPALFFALVCLLFYGESFVESLPLRVLTLLHIIRAPVELVLLWLYKSGHIPRAMTFEGQNFDIVSGVTAPIVYLVAFRDGKVNRAVLIVWNIAALGLLLNIVATAVLAFPSPWQQIAFDQPNRAIMYFPFVWLPAIVVPIVFFSHLASLYKLAKSRLV